VVDVPLVELNVVVETEVVDSVDVLVAVVVED
jgi:hypothetical protein